MEQINELLKTKHNQFKIVNKYERKNLITPLGIGDLLFTVLIINNKMLHTPVYINLNIFKDNYHYPNPINALEFRLNLIKLIYPDNYFNIFELVDDKSIKYHMNVTEIVKIKYQLIDYKIKIVKIINYNVFNKGKKKRRRRKKGKKKRRRRKKGKKKRRRRKKQEYVIFHTKCRFFNGFDYLNLKYQLKLFFKKFKSKYKIILLGEQIFPKEHYEYSIHGITTVYDELLQLKNNNEIIDMTKENIYNELDINNYIKDINIIKYAKYNIHIGAGGQLCSSIFFSDNDVITFNNPIFLKGYKNLLKEEYFHYYYDLKGFFDVLNRLIS